MKKRTAVIVQYRQDEQSVDRFTALAKRVISVKKSDMMTSASNPLQQEKPESSSTH